MVKGNVIAQAPQPSPELRKRLNLDEAEASGMTYVGPIEKYRLAGGEQTGNRTGHYPDIGGTIACPDYRKHCDMREMTMLPTGAHLFRNRKDQEVEVLEYTCFGCSKVVRLLRGAKDN